MAERDYKSSPVSDALGLGAVIDGLVHDLQDMRDRKISPQEGLARAAVAKQLFNGVRLYLQAVAMIEKQNPQAPSIAQQIEKGHKDD